MEDESSFAFNPQQEAHDELRTSSRSGATDVRVLLVGGDLKQGRKGALRGVHGGGSGASGSVKVSYPAEWEGRIDAESTGSVKVGGEGVVVDGEEQVGGRKRVKAHKGSGGEDGGGRIEARTGSGSVDVLVGSGGGNGDGWWW